MKTTNPATPAAERLSWGGLAGVLVATLLLASCGSCLLDRSGIVLDRFRYDCEATIQSGDGRRSVIRSDNLMSFAGPGENWIVDGIGVDEEGESEDARLRYRRILQEVIDRRAGDAAFRALYGTGPWCLVGEVQASRTEEPVEWDDERRFVDSEQEPIPGCSCSETCGNPEGVAGRLELSPSAPDDALAFDFGPVPLGTSRSEDLTLRNTGDGNLCLHPPRIPGGSGTGSEDFQLEIRDGCAAVDERVALPPGGAGVCVVRATFRPTMAGPRTANVPATFGCADFVTLRGSGEAGQLGASPAPACFAPPLTGSACRDRPVRITNLSTASVDVLSAAVAGDGWELLQIADASGDPIELAAEPYPLAPADHVDALVRACAAATADGALRVMHNGTDFGAPGSPTGDVDSG
ncbi:MAG: hypothetical protein ABW221_19775, partial [Vicinamibacteria bacterium]